MVPQTRSYGVKMIMHDAAETGRLGYDPDADCGCRLVTTYGTLESVKILTPQANVIVDSMC